MLYYMYIYHVQHSISTSILIMHADLNRHFVHIVYIYNYFLNSMTLCDDYYYDYNLCVFIGCYITFNLAKASYYIV